MDLDKCTHCNKVMTKPGPNVNVGDFSICIRCGGVMKYEEGMILKGLSQEDIKMLDTDVQNNLLSMQVMRALLPLNIRM